MRNKKKAILFTAQSSKIGFLILYTIMGIRGRRKPTQRKGQTVTGNVSSLGGPLWLFLWLVFGCQATHRGLLNLSIFNTKVKKTFWLKNGT